jgi:hypothetical protein
MEPGKKFIFEPKFYTAPSYYDVLQQHKEKKAFEEFRAELNTTPNTFSRAELKTTPSRLGAPHAPPTPNTFQIPETPKIVAARAAVQRAAREREQNAQRLNQLNLEKTKETQLINSHKLIKDKNKLLGEQDMLKQSSQKLAFSSGNQTVDLIALQSILGADPTLTQGDRNVLVAQARAALRKAPGSSINVNQLRGMGLGMLMGYATSKLVGVGPFGTVASMAIGGGLGSMGRKSGPSWQPGGYYTY